MKSPSTATGVYRDARGKIKRVMVWLEPNQVNVQEWSKMEPAMKKGWVDMTVRNELAQYAYDDRERCWKNRFGDMVHKPPDDMHELTLQSYRIGGHFQGRGSGGVNFTPRR